MQKADMREWIISLEVMLDNKLKKWDKQRKWENGEVVHLLYQWENVLIKLDIFWEDKKEKVRLKYIGPRVAQDFMWDGLDDKTFNKIQDRVGNLSMITFHPPIDPTD